MSSVLDASALLALLFDEPGATIVATRLGNAHISATNYCEVLTRAIDRGFRMEDTALKIRGLQLNCWPFDAEQAAIAAALRAQTKLVGLSLADRACLALGLTLSLPVLTSDQEWTKVDIGVNVELIR